LIFRRIASAAVTTKSDHCTADNIGAIEAKETVETDRDEMENWTGR
jgi:hypothetical protein